MSPSRKKRSGKNSPGRWLRFGAIFILLVIGIAGIYNWYSKRKFHGDLKGIEVNYFRYPVRGIDISHFTGKVDFEQMQDAGMRFVYLRATYGMKTDELFAENYKNAQKHKMPAGAYHYLRFEQDGAKQAQHFLSRIKEKKFQLPHVLDVEEWGNHFLSSRNKVIENIRKFIAVVEKSTGRKVMIYTNESGYRKYIEEHFSAQPLWICSFNDPPNIEADWVFWQHSHIGKLPGAEGWLDYNVFYGDEVEWRRYLRKEKR